MNGVITSLGEFMQATRQSVPVAAVENAGNTFKDAFIRNMHQSYQEETAAPLIAAFEQRHARLMNRLTLGAEDNYLSLSMLAGNIAGIIKWEPLRGSSHTVKANADKDRTAARLIAQYIDAKMEVTPGEQTLAEALSSHGIELRQQSAGAGCSV